MTLFPFRLIMASWGIAIDVRAELRTARQVPCEATKVCDALFLLLSEAVLLSPADIEAFSAGLRRIAMQIRKTLPDGAVAIVELEDVWYHPADYQLEGLEAAAVGWACEYLEIDPPPVRIDFDSERNRYVFSYD